MGVERRLDGAVRLESGNLLFSDGRICSENLDDSYLVSNKNREDLLLNVEVGIKELVIKFMEKGYDILSSCHGHPEDECDNNFKYIKICCENSIVGRLKDNINKINNTYGTTISCDIGIEDTEEGMLNLLNNVCAKTYEEPVNFYINVGRYDDCDYNYEVFLKHFDDYNWEP